MSIAFYYYIYVDCPKTRANPGISASLYTIHKNNDDEDDEDEDDNDDDHDDDVMTMMMIMIMAMVILNTWRRITRKRGKTIES